MIKFIRVFILVILLNLLFLTTISATFIADDVSIMQNVNESETSNYININKEVVQQTKHFGILSTIIFTIIIVLIISVLTIYITKKNNKLKYFLVKNKMIIMIVSIILICSIAIAFGVYAQITNKGITTEKKQENENSYEELKNNFKDIFTNSINKQANTNLNYNYDEILYCAYDIKEEKSGNYNINAKLPLFKLEGDIISNINKEIFDTFGRKIIDIINNSSAYTTYNLDYVAYVNENIISLVIKCNYKDGTNPQRTIIQTYNYDIENDRLLSLKEALDYKKLNKEEVQNKVYNKIKDINKQMQNISEQGYNVYVRNEKDTMYEIDNTSNYFLGKDNSLYIVYAYGNNNFTSEIDLVIF